MNSTMHPSARRAARRFTGIKLSGMLVGVGIATLAVTGCGRRPIVVQAPPATVIPQPVTAHVVTTAPTAPQPQVVVMREAPPPPRHEPMPPPPASDHVWIPGYWAFRNGQQMWVAGHWETPPHPGARWVSPRWDRQGDGYVFVQGYWQ